MSESPKMTTFYYSIQKIFDLSSHELLVLKFMEDCEFFEPELMLGCLRPP